MLGIGLWLNGGGAGFGSSGPAIQLSASTIAEGPAGRVIGTLSVVNGSGTYTFTITADPDAKFDIQNDDELFNDAALDFETASSHLVTIEADNGVDPPITRQFTITVTDVATPTAPTLVVDGDQLFVDFGAEVVDGDSGDFDYDTVVTFDDDPQTIPYAIDAAAVLAGEIEIDTSGIPDGSYFGRADITKASTGETSAKSNVEPFTIDTGYTFVNAEAEAYVGEMVVEPDDTRKELIDDLVGALKTAGVWAKLDTLYLFAAHTEQAALLNAIGPTGSFNATNVSATAFAADAGFTGDGAADYIDSNFNPTTAPSPKITQNSASTFVWVANNAQTNAAVAGYISDATASNRLIPRTTGDLINYRAFTNVASATAANNNSIGLFCMNRSASNAVQAYKDGSSIDTDTTASSALVNSKFSCLRHDSGFTSYQVKAYGFGSSLNSTEQAALHTALNAYMTGL